jgi:hypothetical protein
MSVESWGENRRAGKRKRERKKDRVLEEDAGVMTPMDRTEDDTTYIRKSLSLRLFLFFFNLAHDTRGIGR